MRYRFRDPVSGLTHLAGVFLGFGGLIFLLNRAVLHGGARHIISFSVFGSSLILLYAASALYHLLDVSPNARLILRRLDHAMIAVFIAGSYTPFLLVSLRSTLALSLLGVVWLLAVLGTFMSFVWIHAPRWLTTSLYLFMGWIALIALYPLSKAISSEGLYWLIAGGLFYTIGAVVYAVKWPNPFPATFGFHEIWHLFVLAGSASHFISVSTIS